MGHRKRGQDEEGGIAVETVKAKLPKLKEPPKFAVVLHNDDYTTMEFVLEVLQKFFQKSQAEAVDIMLRVHNEGKGAAGIYSYQIAETKSAQVNEYARTHGYPLKSSVEPVA